PSHTGLATHRQRFGHPSHSLSPLDDITSTNLHMFNHLCVSSPEISLGDDGIMVSSTQLHPLAHVPEDRHVATMRDAMMDHRCRLDGAVLVQAPLAKRMLLKEGESGLLPLHAIATLVG